MNELDNAQTISKNTLPVVEWNCDETTAPPGVEVIAKFYDGSEVFGAIRQADGEWWWRDRFFASGVGAWRPMGTRVSNCTESKPVVWVVLDTYALAAIGQGVESDPFIESFHSKEEAEDFVDLAGLASAEFQIIPAYFK